MRTNIIGRFKWGLLGVLCTGVLIIGAQVDTRVADAAMAGDTETVRSLLRGAADVN